MARVASLLVMSAALAAFPAAAQEGTVDEVVVTGQRASQQKAIDAKRKATAVIDAISADELGNPDGLAAEARVPLDVMGGQLPARFARAREARIIGVSEDRI